MIEFFPRGTSNAFILSFILFVTFLPGVEGQSQTREQRLAKIALRRLDDISVLFEGWHHVGEHQTDSLSVDSSDDLLTVYLSSSVTHIPVRYPWVESLRARLAEMLGFRFRNYDIELMAGGRLLEEYIPNYYRDSYLPEDQERIIKREGERRLVRIEGKPEYEGGLSGSHIALWPSHGYYYEAGLDRWEWQRARLFGTIEDMYPFSYVQPYLLPMLENAGAYVLMPRERDTRRQEVIVDNDGSTGESELVIENGLFSNWDTLHSGGFAIRDTLFEGDNPFRMGSHLRINTHGNSDAAVSYIPDIPEDGYYAVYISWAESSSNISSVRCRINHSGDSSVLYLDQTMGFGTWIYLGTFHFFKGKNTDTGSLVLSGDSDEDGFITADAVRFGGGMGNVARKPAEVYVPSEWSLSDGGEDDSAGSLLSFINEPEWKLSGRPRYMEGARYFLQYSGMPDSTVYSINKGKNDYNDDYMSRGEWVSYLAGDPMETTGEPAAGSPRIPIDLAFAFHTDAGVTLNDSIIGTLAIYSSDRTEGVYHSGASRLAGRDLSDMIQSQLINDIRLQVNTGWTRRGLWDRQYSEAWRPHVPTMLLELLSHQNLADLRFGLDPRFRFIVSRAVYKGMLRYLAPKGNRQVIIQPLPPDHMAAEKTGSTTVRLSWQEVADELEPTAGADGYMVYMSRENAGFDSGTAVRENFIDIGIPEPETIYNFRVTAVNEGGESMPGEILSVSLGKEEDKPVLIVNAFTRISGPAVFDKQELAGVAWWDDHGVPDKYDLSHTGVQYDFNRSSAWLDDDSPGWGASYSDMEGNMIPGNSFNFPSVYGRSLRDAGYSFVSVSRKVFEQRQFNPEDYHAVIVIFGEERGTPRWLDQDTVDFRVFTPGMINSLGSFAESGGNIFLSGAYIGTDMVENDDSIAIRFARDVLGFQWRTNFATKTGDVEATDQIPSSFPRHISFNTVYLPGIYTVEAPDAIEPAGEDSWRIYRYSSNLTSAGVIKSGRHRVVTLGFPFETIVSPDQRLLLMRQVMNFFNQQ